MRRYFLLVSIPIFLSGCSVGDFLGAYFNTFYNAQKIFTEAEQEVLNLRASVAPSRTEKPFLAPFDVPIQAKGKFTTVIEKCSKLLQYHPESKLVDDALLMIGKSYYYQNEYQSAERKFKELLSTYPESDLIYETKLLLGNTYYKNNDKLTAATTAKELLEEAKKDDLDEIVARSANLLAHIEVENKNYTDALGYYLLAADLSETSEEQAAAYRAMAEIHIQQGKYKDAADAFVSSSNVSNDYVGAYRGQIGEARMLSKIGLYEESLKLLDVISNNANYREFLGEVDLEIANVYREEKDFPAAEEQYRYVDTAYARTEIAAISYHQLGMLYELMLNYDSARVSYDKGKAEFPQAEITVALVKRSEALNKYILHRTEIARYDSIRKFLFQHPDTTRKVAVLKDSTHLSESRSKTEVMQDSTYRPQSRSKMEVMQDSTRLPESRSKMVAMQDSSYFPQSRSKMVAMQDSTHLPESRSKMVAMQDSAQHDSTESLTQVDSLTSKAPTIPPPPMDTVRARLAYNESELAGLFYESMGLPDSAAYWYKHLLKDFPESPYAPRALYTLTQIYNVDSLGTPEEVDSLHREIVQRFPNSEFAAESRRHLKLPEPKKKIDPIATSYQFAEAMVNRGEVNAALTSLKGIAEFDSTSPFAAKAQYAIGWIYENVKQNSDSSIANYQKLLKRFPNSTYAIAVQPKLAEVENQKQQNLQALKKDSVAVQEIKKDSIAVPTFPGGDKMKMPFPQDSVKVLNDSPVPSAPDPKKDDEENPKP